LTFSYNKFHRYKTIFYWSLVIGKIRGKANLIEINKTIYKKEKSYFFAYNLGQEK
jgi:hypothetical protein